MAQNIRVSKLMSFGIDVVKNKAKVEGWYSPVFKDSDYINYFVSEWLRNNISTDELIDSGFYDL